MPRRTFIVEVVTAGPQGPPGTPGSGGGGFVGTPTRIPAGTTFTVPADTQVLAVIPIKVEGTLVVLGTLVMLTNFIPV